MKKPGGIPPGQKKIETSKVYQAFNALTRWARRDTLRDAVFL